MKMISSFESADGGVAILDKDSLLKTIKQAVAPFHKTDITLDLISCDIINGKTAVSVTVTGRDSLYIIMNMWIKFNDKATVATITLRTFVDGILKVSTRLLGNTIYFKSILNKQIKRIGA